MSSSEPFTPEKIRGGGERFKYPWTTFSKIQQFPYKFHWKYSRFLRFYIYSCVLLFPAYWKFDKLTNSESNVAAYQEVVKARKHTFFDIPHEIKDD